MSETKFCPICDGEAGECEDCKLIARGHVHCGACEHGRDGCKATCEKSDRLDDTFGDFLEFQAFVG